MVRCLLINPFPESALNEEAGKLFMEDYDAYFKKARMLTEVHALVASKKGEASGSSGELLAETSAAHLDGMSACWVAGLASARLLRQSLCEPLPESSVFVQQMLAPQDGGSKTYA